MSSSTVKIIRFVATVLIVIHFTSQCSISAPPRKRQNTEGLTFSGVIEMEHWNKMGQP